MVSTISSVTFPKKINIPQVKYSTIEKEALSLLLALQHFEVYLFTSLLARCTDHNALVFIKKRAVECEPALGEVVVTSAGFLFGNSAQKGYQ